MYFHRRIAPRVALIAAAGIALACSSNWRKDLKPVAHQKVFDCADGETPSITLRYLGSGGWFIEGPSKDAILTAPFFSNPGFLEIALSRIGVPLQEDPERIREGMGGVPKTASAVLVGHSHYDHLMEVSTIAGTYAPKATIYVNRTGLNLLDEESRARSEVLDDSAGSVQAPGRWLPSPDKAPIRFMALRSEHAPHLGPIKLFKGDVTEPNPNPRNAWKWREGQTHAFLIDIMRDGKPVFRIHYQDSASNPPYGFPPDLDDGKAVDVAILCMASFGNVNDYPGALLADLSWPRHVLVGHWENFFTTGDLGPVPFTSTRKFKKALAGITFTTPEPGTSLRFCVH